MKSMIAALLVCSGAKWLLREGDKAQSVVQPHSPGPDPVVKSGGSLYMYVLLPYFTEKMKGRCHL